ncbi:MerR family transcriptional regulator [Streptomyces uncialis]|uniref:MerR family transcriptional regulator n=1 Tax=Streptomyces uncialis TaxID=1048205 RepID=UPI002256A75D|nr:MerR family transcriptional regulator [Streptomyces uncialis]MCX4661486.1 MerR family transcriptional regulator [Streptomyces uncialis]
MSDRLYTGTEAAALATTWRQAMTGGAAAVSLSAISHWRTRGHLTTAGLDPCGRPLYTLRAIASAEEATRAGALRAARRHDRAA